MYVSTACTNRNSRRRCAHNTHSRIPCDVGEQEYRAMWSRKKKKRRRQWQNEFRLAHRRKHRPKSTAARIYELRLIKSPLFIAHKISGNNFLFHSPCLSYANLLALHSNGFLTAFFILRSQTMSACVLAVDVDACVNVFGGQKKYVLTFHFKCDG